MINQNIMVGEDIRSIAFRNFNNLTNLRVQLKEKNGIIQYQNNDIESKDEMIKMFEKVIDDE